MDRALSAVALVFGLLPGPAGAADFRSAADAAVVLYDAPSAKARKLYIVNKGYPLEVVVQVEGWIKVRDAASTLSWAEAKALDNARGVLVKAAIATVRQKPADDAPAAFDVQLATCCWKRWRARTAAGSTSSIAMARSVMCAPPMSGAAERHPDAAACPARAGHTG